MEEVVQNMDRIPGMKTKLFNRLASAERNWEDIKGNEGIIAGRNARKRLYEGKVNREEQRERKLEEMITQTAQRSALHAINLEKLLKRKWNEDKDSYFILSNLKTQKQTRRINDLCFNR